MKVELDWHVPLPADWSKDKKEAALERLVMYMRQGTIYETRTRMSVTHAEVTGSPHMRHISFTLEN